MTKKPCRTLIIVLAVLSVVLAFFSAFSLSYAEWVAAGDKTFCTLSIGEWNATRFEDFTDQDVKDILNGESGIVTSGGQVIKFDENGKCTVTLAEGESFYLCAGDKVINVGFGGSTLLGATINKPDSIETEGSVFTATEGGTFDVEYTQNKIIGFTLTGVKITPV